EKICLKCLNKDPRKRYGSALGLARNLERWLADVPIIDPPDPIPTRCRLWCRRNPVLTGLLVSAAALFMVVSMMVVRTSRDRAERLEEEVLMSNGYAARGVASTILLQARRWASAVYVASESPELRSLLEQDQRPELQRFLEQTYRTHRGMEGLYIESWYLLNGEGVLVAC